MLPMSIVCKNYGIEQPEYYDFHFLPHYIKQDRKSICEVGEKEKMGNTLKLQTDAGGLNIGDTT